MMCELMEQLVQENEAAAEYFILLMSSLKLLSGMTRNSETLLIFFYLKLLEIAGLFPELEVCIKCKKHAREPCYFDAGSGGILCAACSAAAISAPTYAAWFGGIGRLFCRQRSRMARRSLPSTCSMAMKYSPCALANS